MRCRILIAAAWCCWFCCAWSLTANEGLCEDQSSVTDPPSAVDFDRRIAPLLAQHCLTCHGADEPKGGLDLSSHVTAISGGESGIVLVPQQPDQSLLWQYVDADQMPPKKPLSANEKALLKDWIAGGAVWGTAKIDPFRYTTDSRAGSDWWSLQPLSAAPAVALSEAQPTSTPWVRNAVDTFVLARLQAAGLRPSEEADARTLIRRLSFDLTGLPPTPEQIEQFLADTSDQGYERLVDQLLASPHYGERWARHWLDLVRFGESHGFEYDQPREHAWHYRNWVIDALNQNMPYDQFAQWQLAGDVLSPEDVNALAATGFLVAGPHNTTLPSNDKMRMAMAQDELEELVGIVGQTFLGLTVNCARCHDHKFDPISQLAYYEFAAALAGVTHGERTVEVELTEQQQFRLGEITEQLLRLQDNLEQLERPVREAILQEQRTAARNMPEPPRALANWEFDDLRDSHGQLHGTLHGGAVLDDGCLVLNGQDAYLATSPLGMDLHARTLEAWVKLDNHEQRGGGVISIQALDGSAFDAIVYGEREPGQWMAGSNNFLRTMPFGGVDETEATSRFVQIAVVYDSDGTITGYRDGQLYGKPYRPRELQPFRAGQSHILLGLRHSPAGGNRLLTGRIQRAQLYDRGLSPEEIAASAGRADQHHISRTQLIARLTETQRQQHDRLTTEQTELQQKQASILTSRQRTLYACVSTDPGVSWVLRRGDVSSPGDEVTPSGLSAIVGLDADFHLAADAADAVRRERLAAWVTSSDNPLFARVMMNRLWQYHFGRGLVTTSSDLGFNGGQPSHPELLEWLAQEFRRQAFSLKFMHRLMVTSATYRQAATWNADAVRADADNRLLWRRRPQRLSAEEIRDAGLVFSDRMDATVGGLGYRDVRHFKFRGSHFYESISEPAASDRRRTIYRFAPRGGHNPFLNTFDCPDPSVTTPARASTTTPLQALALMNNDLMFQMADDFAARVLQEVGDSAATSIARVYLISYGRPATADEIHAAVPFVETHGLAAFCRVVLNSNEFLHVR